MSTRILSKKMLPSTEHFAVLVYTSLYIPGDERSRTNPGHGYPGENKDIVEYLYFVSEQSLKDWLGMTSNQRLDYSVLSVKPLKVNSTLSFSFE